MKNNKTSIITPFQIAKKVDFGLIKNEQNKFDIHTNILANFSKPFKSNIKDSYHLFTNVYFFDYDILDIDPNVLIERTSRILGYQKYFLIIVYPEYGEIKTETIYSNHHPNCEIVVMHTSFEDLFKSGLMNKIYLENDNSTLAYRTVMIFRGWTYSGLQTVFRIQNIILSGGASQKRHILNPSVHRFSQFISAFESCNLNGVITSFHNVQPLEMESGSFIKGALGPKSYKDKNAIGDISTKAFDIRWRALFKKYFDTELPIRGNKHLVSAKRIGTNVSANTQNNDSLVTNENAQISQISINLQRDSKNEIDFDNDPWIDDSLKSNLYNTLSASEKALIDNKVKQSVESWKQRLLAEILNKMKIEIIN